MRRALAIAAGRCRRWRRGCAQERPIAAVRAAFGHRRSPAPTCARCRPTTPPIRACCGSSAASSCGMRPPARRTSCASCHGDARGVDARRGRALSRLRCARLATSSTSMRASTRAARERQQRAAAAARVGRPAGAQRLRRLPVARHADRRDRSTVRRAPRSSAAARSTCERHGQMNLACTQCHDQNWGKRLSPRRSARDTAPRFPRIGSSGRAWVRCSGAFARASSACARKCRRRAHRELTDVELYLAWRAQGLPLEAPGVRR